MEAALSLRTEQALDKAKDLKAQLNKYIIDFKSISKGQIHRIYSPLNLRFHIFWVE